MANQEPEDCCTHRIHRVCHRRGHPGCPDTCLRSRYQRSSHVATCSQASTYHHREQSCAGRISQWRIVGGCSAIISRQRQGDRTMQINASLSLSYVSVYTGYNLPRTWKEDMRSREEVGRELWEPGTVQHLGGAAINKGVAEFSKRSSFSLQWEL